jgi:hypothetical protein
MENNINKALLAAQKEFTAVVFDSKNPHFKSKFASLKAMIEATKPALQKHGFIVVQPWKTTEDGNILLITRLMHENGPSMDSECVIVRGNKTDQQLGSSLTYMRRYQYASLLNLVAEEEDDGEANEDRNKKQASEDQATAVGNKPAPQPWKPAPAKQPSAPTSGNMPVKGNKLGELKMILIEEDMPIERLEEYLAHRTKTSGYTIDKTLEAIFSEPQILNKFFDLYSTWLNEKGYAEAQ